MDWKGFLSLVLLVGGLLGGAVGYFACRPIKSTPRKAHIIHPDGTQEHRPLTPDEEEQLRPMTVEEFEEFKAELRKGLTPHWEDGRWEIVKRWPKPYPFVTWGWVWDGRKDEPTIFMESSEASPPAKPPRWLPHPIEDVVPGTKNNL